MYYLEVVVNSKERMMVKLIKDSFLYRGNRTPFSLEPRGFFVELPIADWRLQIYLFTPRYDCKFLTYSSKAFTPAGDLTGGLGIIIFHQQINQCYGG